MYDVNGVHEKSEKLCCVFSFAGILAALDLGSSQLPPSYLRLTTSADCSYLFRKFLFFKIFLQVSAPRTTLFAIFVLKSLREKSLACTSFHFTNITTNLSTNCNFQSFQSKVLTQQGCYQPSIQCYHLTTMFLSAHCPGPLVNRLINLLGNE